MIWFWFVCFFCFVYFFFNWQVVEKRFKHGYIYETCLAESATRSLAALTAVLRLDCADFMDWSKTWSCSRRLDQMSIGRSVCRVGRSAGCVRKRKVLVIKYGFFTDPVWWFFAGNGVENCSAPKWRPEIPSWRMRFCGHFPDQ